MVKQADPRPLAALEAAREAGRRLLATGPLSLARMGGTSIAAPSSAGWVTDFLNAAYYARPRERRDLDDLRLAFAVLTTAWHHLGRRLRLGDLRAFHSTFGADRLRRTPTSGTLTLDRAELLDGGERLLGPAFAEGYGDPSRHAWGIVFRDPGELRAYNPQVRVAGAPLRELTPPRRPPAEQTWHTYPAVPLPSAAATLELLEQPPRWPDCACELGRFTPVRRGGLLGQTFEIEVARRSPRGRRCSRAPM